jgi:hypothetical protein
MAIFQEKQISFGAINGGIRYSDGDIPNAETFNAPIEASAYAQKLAIKALDTAEKVQNSVLGNQTGTYPALSAYPVGSIYISTTRQKTPAEIFGGEWTQIKDYFLLAASDTYAAGSTGGSANAVAVSHDHNVTAVGESAIVSLYSGSGTSYGVKLSSTTESKFTDTSFAGRLKTNTVGESGVGKNMPPYLAVYMWQRTG